MEPLKGKAALLGEKKTLSFCDVSTGKGLKSGSCFAVSREGILCEFNSKRHLSKWVDLRVSFSSERIYRVIYVGKSVFFCVDTYCVLSGSWQALHILWVCRRRNPSVRSVVLGLPLNLPKTPLSRCSTGCLYRFMVRQSFCSL